MKSKSTAKKVWSVVSTLLYVLLLGMLIMAVIANFTKKENQMAGLFGYSFAVIKSPSMEAGGFNVGDTVMVKNVPTDNLRKGDIIVFYQYEDPADALIRASFKTNPSEYLITDQVENGTYQDFSLDASTLNRQSQEYAASATGRMIFHRIVDIYADEYGTRFFETKGDSNAGKDPELIREDFVCAKYVSASPLVTGFMSFITTPLGLAVVIILPIMLTVALQIFSFSGDVKSSRIASRLLGRQMRAEDVDFSKVKLADFLAPAEKVYLYDISSKEIKPNLSIILWDESVEDGLKKYETNRDEFYKFFHDHFGKSDKKKLEFLKIKADILLAQPEISEQHLDKMTKVVYKDHKGDENATRN